MLVPLWRAAVGGKSNFGAREPVCCQEACSSAVYPRLTWPVRLRASRAAMKRVPAHGVVGASTTRGLESWLVSARQLGKRCHLLMSEISRCRAGS